MNKTLPEQNFPKIPFTSKELITSSPHPTLRKIPNKYLARTFNLNQDDGMRQKQINLKRIHIRSIIEAEKADDEEDNEEAKQLAIKHKICHKKKLFRGLTYVAMSSFFHLNWLEELKHCKNLVHFRCDPYDNSPQENIIRYFQKFNKNLEQVHVIMSYLLNMDSSNVKKLSKAINKLHNLKSYGCYRTIGETEEAEESLTKSEFLYLNKCLTRLPKLENFECEIIEYHLDGLWKIMNEGKVYEKVTMLSMNLTLGPFGEEEDDDGVSPFFQLQTFPNLKELKISASIARSDIMDFHPRFGDFVVQGFQKLSHLEKLSLQLSSFSTGINFMFEGLLHLPQLSSFSFEIDSMEPQNWGILIQFLQSQTNLVWVEIKVENLNAFREKQVLEDLIASLSHISKLQYLNLVSNTWPLHILSKGFNRLTETNHIKSFQLRAENKLFGCPREILPSLQGLCEFLLRNKNTLSELQIDLPLFKEPELNDYSAAVISQLTHLKTLTLNISSSSVFDIESLCFGCVYLNQVPFNSSKDDKKCWNLRLNDILPKLEKLEDLTLEFDRLKDCPSEKRNCMIDCFKTMSSLNNLRNFKFSLPGGGLSQTEANSINSALKDLKRLNSIKFLNLGQLIDDEDIEEIAVTVVALQYQQSLKMNLSF